MLAIVVSIYGVFVNLLQLLSQTILIRQCSAPIGGLVQDCSNSSALATELLQ